jgi:hypothetical protein
MRSANSSQEALPLRTGYRNLLEESLDTCSKGARLVLLDHTANLGNSMLNNWKVGEYTVEHLALETRTVNESRKVCNLYGPGPQCLPCIHEQIGLPACLCPPNPFKLA